jgi:2-dehydro-3-deoxygalactonokinase
MLFATRALVLQGRLPAEKRFDFLSGLLIGDELRSALPTRADREPILVGEPALCERYVRAATVFGVPLVAMEQPTPAGLWTIAASAGLANAPVTHG